MSRRESWRHSAEHLRPQPAAKANHGWSAPGFGQQSATTSGPARTVFGPAAKAATGGSAPSAHVFGRGARPPRPSKIRLRPNSPLWHPGFGSCTFSLLRRRRPTTWQALSTIGSRPRASTKPASVRRYNIIFPKMTTTWGWTMIRTPLSNLRKRSHNQPNYFPLLTNASLCCLMKWIDTPFGSCTKLHVRFITV